jgi:predicted DNA-binding transcriptional regulator AlpA
MTRTKNRKPKPPTAALSSPLPPMLTRQQVCALVHLSYVSIWRLIRSQRFPAAINIAPGDGIRNRWSTREVLAWWEEQERAGKRQTFAGADAQAEA